jgi:DNA-binding transcriptional MerR regulator
MTSSMSRSTLTIGAVAKRAGVRVDTVRYYERRGVLPPADRRTSGYRAFRPEVVERIVFVKALQSFGFGLDEIVAVLRLIDAGTGECASVRGFAESTLTRIDAKIADLAATRARLAAALVGCDRGACAHIEDVAPRVRLPIARGPRDE